MSQNDPKIFLTLTKKVVITLLKLFNALELIIPVIKTLLFTPKYSSSSKSFSFRKF